MTRDEARAIWKQIVGMEREEYVGLTYAEARAKAMDLAYAGEKIYQIPKNEAADAVSWLLREVFPTEWAEDPELGRDTAQTVLLSDIQNEPIFWLWLHRIPLARTTLLDGDPGLGKSTLTMDIAARVTVGMPFPDLFTPPCGKVIVLTAEDNLSDTVRPRLDAAGADLGRVIAIRSIVKRSGRKEQPDIARDLAAIERLVDWDTKLLIVDPLMAYLPPEINAYRDHEVRRALVPLASFAAKTGVAVLLVRHLTKDDKRSALHAGGGSIGIAGAARSVLLIGKHWDNPDRRILAPVKTNLCKMPGSWGFEIEANSEGIPTIAWENGPVNITADDLVAGRRKTRFEED